MKALEFLLFLIVKQDPAPLAQFIIGWVWWVLLSP